MASLLKQDGRLSWPNNSVEGRDLGKSCTHAQSHTNQLINTSAVAWQKSEYFKMLATLGFQTATAQPFFRIVPKLKLSRNTSLMIKHLMEKAF